MEGGCRQSAAGLDVAWCSNLCPRALELYRFGIWHHHTSSSSSCEIIGIHWNWILDSLDFMRLRINYGCLIDRDWAEIWLINWDLTFPFFGYLFNWALVKYLYGWLVDLWPFGKGEGWSPPKRLSLLGHASCFLTLQKCNYILEWDKYLVG